MKAKLEVGRRNNLKSEGGMRKSENGRSLILAREAHIEKKFIKIERIPQF